MTNNRVGRVLALLVGAVGVGALVLGARLPWLTSLPGGDLGSDQSPVPLVVSAVAAVAAVALQLRPRWLPLPLLVMLGAVAAATLGTQPGSLCWDGVDADGNPVGGCETQEWTAAPAVYAAGAALVMLGGAIAWVTGARPARPGGSVPAR